MKISNKNKIIFSIVLVILILFILIVIAYYILFSPKTIKINIYNNTGTTLENIVIKTHKQTTPLILNNLESNQSITLETNEFQKGENGVEIQYNNGKKDSIAYFEGAINLKVIINKILDDNKLKMEVKTITPFNSNSLSIN